MWVILGGELAGATRVYDKQCSKVDWNMPANDPLASTLKSKYSRGVVMWFKENPPKMTSVIHECLHAAWHMVESTGCPVNEETHETITYLQEYLFRQIGMKIYSKAIQKQI